MGDEEPFIGLTVLVVEDNYLVAYILVAAECIVKGLASQPRALPRIMSSSARRRSCIHAPPIGYQHAVS
jgi:hypothetical protein